MSNATKRLADSVRWFLTSPEIEEDDLERALSVFDAEVERERKKISGIRNHVRGRMAAGRYVWIRGEDADGPVSADGGPDVDYLLERLEKAEKRWRSFRESFEALYDEGGAFSVVDVVDVLDEMDRLDRSDG